MRNNALGPGQRFVAAAEVCSRILARDNDVTIQWVPAHSEATSNEVGEYARSAATGDATVIERIPEGYIKETSLPHMTRVATEAGFCEAAEWISGHAMVQAPLGTRLPPAPTQKKALASRYYQLLSGYAATGTQRLMTDSSKCWRCASGEPSRGTISSHGAGRGPAGKM